MFRRVEDRLRWAAFLLLPCAFLCPPAVAGGPKYVAGPGYFNAGVVGHPLRWNGGVVRYFVDQGPLSASVDNQQAVAMVDAAAALWSAVPTAGVTLVDSGALNEDVAGTNALPGSGAVAATTRFAQPADVTPSAINYPVAVVFDADGSVINALVGAGASDPNACQNNGVFAWVDNVNPDAKFAHAVLLLNGLCANTSSRLAMMSFQLERAFGRVLGLDYSQVNPGALASGDPNKELGMAVMQPMSGACGSFGGSCIPQPTLLRPDDIAALNRLYPITALNQASFPGKEITAAHTISIQGTVSFREGTGMEGVNVVARPLDADGNPLYAYTVTAVSGALFRGNRGNPVSGWNDANGNPLNAWGSDDPTLQGFFDLSGIPLPPGTSTANYEVSFEPINALYMMQSSVGPYVDGSPSPSGDLPTIFVSGMTSGASQTLTVPVDDSAVGNSSDAIATESGPRPVPPSGEWTGRLSQVGQTDWFAFPVRANRTFTVVTQALNEGGVPTEGKAIPAVGVWDGYDAAGAAPALWAPGLNGYGTGETFLTTLSPSDDVIRIGISDMRGDGRPDYSYEGWILYADTVIPSHLPTTGGPIVIEGMGFHPSDSVLVGGKAAVVTSVSPNEITAIAPASASTGSVNVEVDDLPIYSAAAVISAGVSYDAGTGDSLTLVTAPSNTVPIGVPIPFTVTALGTNLTPAGGITVTYSAGSGTAALGCGQSQCSVTTSGDGTATLSVTALSTTASIVTASLANGASLQAHFTGGAAPVLSALTPNLSVAAGTTVAWTEQALVLSHGTPMSGQTVAWQSGSAGILAQSSMAAISNGSGIASKTLNVGPLNEGQQVTNTACVNGTANCALFTATGARPEYAVVEPVSGTMQNLSISGTPAQIVLRVRDMNGNAMAGGTVTLYQALYAWAPPCSPQGRCASSELLSTETSTAVSAMDGSVIFTPASLAGVPTALAGLATTGNASAVMVEIEQHP
ncbi:MAG TPA: IPT/TIG domain-containing protein [Terracidiphilus sp.]|nr:IPT/TIG domain-containing protein [Terracidiphilus sp.]